MSASECTDGGQEVGSSDANIIDEHSRYPATNTDTLRLLRFNQSKRGNRNFKPNYGYVQTPKKRHSILLMSSDKPNKKPESLSNKLNKSSTNLSNQTEDNSLKEVENVNTPLTPSKQPPSICKVDEYFHYNLNDPKVSSTTITTMSSVKLNDKYSNPFITNALNPFQSSSSSNTDQTIENANADQLEPKYQQNVRNSSDNTSKIASFREPPGFERRHSTTPGILHIQGHPEIFHNTQNVQHINSETQMTNKEFSDQLRHHTSSHEEPKPTSYVRNAGNNNLSHFVPNVNTRPFPMNATSKVQQTNQHIFHLPGLEAKAPYIPGQEAVRSLQLHSCHEPSNVFSTIRADGLPYVQPQMEPMLGFAPVPATMLERHENGYNMQECRLLHPVTVSPPSLIQNNSNLNCNPQQSRGTMPTPFPTMNQNNEEAKVPCQTPNPWNMTQQHVSETAAPSAVQSYQFSNYTLLGSNVMPPSGLVHNGFYTEHALHESQAIKCNMPSAPTYHPYHIWIEPPKYQPAPPVFQFQRTMSGDVDNKQQSFMKPYNRISIGQHFQPSFGSSKVRKIVDLVHKPKIDVLKNGRSSSVIQKTSTTGSNPSSYSNTDSALLNMMEEASEKMVSALCASGCNSNEVTLIGTEEDTGTIVDTDKSVKISHEGVHEVSDSTSFGDNTRDTCNVPPLSLTPSSDGSPMYRYHEDAYNIAAIATAGCTQAENIALSHKTRPCFKNIHHLCSRTKIDIQKPDSTVANINSQGMPWATKDFIFAFIRMANCWVIMKGYLNHYHEKSLSKVEQCLSPGIRECFYEWQIHSRDLMEHMIRTFNNLEQESERQRNTYQQIERPWSFNRSVQAYKMPMAPQPCGLHHSASISDFRLKQPKPEYVDNRLANGMKSIVLTDNFRRKHRKKTAKSPTSVTKEFSELQNEVFKNNSSSFLGESMLSKDSYSSVVQKNAIPTVTVIESAMQVEKPFDVTEWIKNYKSPRTPETNFGNATLNDKYDKFYSNCFDCAYDSTDDGIRQPRIYMKPGTYNIPKKRTISSTLISPIGDRKVEVPAEASASCIGLITSTPNLDHFATEFATEREENLRKSEADAIWKAAQANANVVLESMKQFTQYQNSASSKRVGSPDSDSDLCSYEDSDSTTGPNTITEDDSDSGKNDADGSKFTQRSLNTDSSSTCSNATAHSSPVYSNVRQSDICDVAGEKTIQISDDVTTAPSTAETINDSQSSSINLQLFNKLRLKVNRKRRIQRNIAKSSQDLTGDQDNKEANDNENKMNFRTLQPKYSNGLDETCIRRFEVICNAITLTPESKPFRDDFAAKYDSDYYRIVRSPIFLWSIKTKLKNNVYTDVGQVVHDFRRIFYNSKLYNEVHPNEKFKQNLNIISNKFETMLADRFLSFDFSQVTGNPQEIPKAYQQIGWETPKSSRKN